MCEQVLPICKQLSLTRRFIVLPWISDFLDLLYMHVFFSVGCFTYAHDSQIIRGTWHRSQCRGWIFGVEKLLQVENSTGHRWDLNPGACRQHGHCCKIAKPLRHLDRSYEQVIDRLYIFCSTIADFYIFCYHKCNRVYNCSLLVHPYSYWQLAK